MPFIKREYFVGATRRPPAGEAGVARTEYEFMKIDSLETNDLFFSKVQSKIFHYADSALIIFLCVGVFFLPRSIAIINAACVLMLLAFCVKRSVIYSASLQNQKAAKGSATFMQRVRIFFRSFKPVNNPINGWLLVIGICILLSLAANGFESIGVRKFFSRYLKEIYLFFLSVEALNSRQRLYSFFSAFFLSLVLVVSDGIYQFCTNMSFFSGNSMVMGRVTGAFRHGNDFGTYLVMVLPVLLCILLMDLKVDVKMRLVPFKNKWAVAILFLNALFLLGATFSRGAWFSFICSVIFLLLVDKKKKFLLMGAFLLAFFILFFYFASYARLDIIFSGPSLGDFFSLSNRLPYWQTACLVIGIYPFFGVGYGNYVGKLKQMYLEPLQYSHNGYLQMGAEIGLLGLAVYVHMMVRFFIASLRNAKRIAEDQVQQILFGLLAGLLGFLVHSSFDTAFTSIKLASFMWIMMGATVAVQHLGLNNQKLKEL
ncbi:MAG TPA: O-antigen ligase family protein [Candidatus Omnitrophota bacterium]|nr:O-antigen ligase family protein [Candidatus Omnitrophota bacterium]